jgi:hypothetical protein
LPVSTLLEILAQTVDMKRISTGVEKLDVSTLLEILGLMRLVIVGF